jgi:hypothetical protein
MKKALIIFKNNSIFFRRQGVWGFLALVFSLLAEIPIILAGLVMISEINEVKDVTMGIALVILLIFGFKIMIQGMGQANSIVVNLFNLIPLPISSKNKFLYLFSLRSFSISTIYFITFFSILTYGIIRKEVFAGIYTGALFLLFILMIDVCMTDVILFFGRVFKKHKVIPMLLFYFFFAPVLLSSTKIIPGDQLFDYINRVPVLNWPGNGVYAAMSGQWLNAGLNMLYIVAFSIAGYLLGIFMIKKKYYI